MQQTLLLISLFVFSETVFAGYYPMYSSWEQPGGPGSELTLTYSFSNLYDGSILDFTTGKAMDISLMRSIFARALQDYADVLPIHFIEIVDNGPLPESGEYDPAELADIRVGQVAHIDDANAYAYFPFTGSGLAGDIVFNAERFGYNWFPALFYAVAQHELGHSLGMGHYLDDEIDELIYFDDLTYSQQSSYTGAVYPLHPEMIIALQNVYGIGVGSVTPISLPASFYLLLSCIIFIPAGFNRTGLR